MTDEDIIRLELEAEEGVLSTLARGVGILLAPPHVAPPPPPPEPPELLGDVPRIRAADWGRFAAEPTTTLPQLS